MGEIAEAMIEAEMNGYDPNDFADYLIDRMEAEDDPREQVDVRVRNITKHGAAFADRVDTGAGVYIAVASVAKARQYAKIQPGTILDAYLVPNRRQDPRHPFFAVSVYHADD